MGVLSLVINIEVAQNVFRTNIFEQVHPYTRKTEQYCGHVIYPYCVSDPDPFLTSPLRCPPLTNSDQVSLILTLSLTNIPNTHAKKFFHFFHFSVYFRFFSFTVFSVFHFSFK